MSQGWAPRPTLRTSAAPAPSAQWLGLAADMPCGDMDPATACLAVLTASTLMAVLVAAAWWLAGTARPRAGAGGSPVARLCGLAPPRPPSLAALSVLRV